MSKANDEKNRIIDNVRSILKNYPESRGDDRVLLTYYWYMYDNVQFEGIKRFATTFKKATSADSITRARREIQYGKHQKTRYLPEDDKAVGRRKQRAQQFQSFYQDKKTKGGGIDELV